MLLAALISMFILLCFLLIIVITMQDSQSRLGTGFGVHDSSTDSFLGASVPKFIKKMTTILAIIYFSTAIVISSVVSWEGKSIYADIDPIVEEINEMTS
ncbi:MAG: preprotein translocase subunit SecG [Chlamydiia bacterium]|nr:preprotein translocase subunit SecG [Chlamydiia bacterium]